MGDGMDDRSDETTGPRPSDDNAGDALDAVAPERPLAALPGADLAALGLTPPVGLEPSTAEVDPTFFEPPAAFDQDEALRQSKPWGTSLAYQSGQVGVDADDVGDEEGHVGRAQGEDPPPDA